MRRVFRWRRTGRNQWNTVNTKFSVSVLQPPTVNAAAGTDGTGLLIVIQTLLAVAAAGMGLFMLAGVLNFMMWN